MPRRDLGDRLLTVVGGSGGWRYELQRELRGKLWEAIEIARLVRCHTGNGSAEHKAAEAAANSLRQLLELMSPTQRERSSTSICRPAIVNVANVSGRDLALPRGDRLESEVQ